MWDAMFGKLEDKLPGQKKAEVEAGVPAGRFAGTGRFDRHGNIPGII